MPTLDCSPATVVGVPRSTQLITDGAVVPITITSDNGARLNLSALIDTGSFYSGIDDNLARQLKLVVMRQDRLNVLNQQILVNVYRAEIEIPALGIREFAGFVGGIIRGKQSALLGRTQLFRLDLAYNGPRGEVLLTR